MSNTYIYIFWGETLLEWSLGIINLFYLFRFWSFRHFPTVNKRHTLLVVFQNISGILFLVVEKPAYMYLSFIKTYNAEYWPVAVLETVGFWLGVYGLISFVIARAWLLSYDVHLSLANSEKKWIIHINSNEGSVKVKGNHQWYVKHKNTLGNDRFLFLYVLLPGIICLCGVVNTLKFILKNIMIIRTIQFTAFLFCTILYFYLWKYHLPSYHDYIFLRAEMKWISYISMVVVASYAIYALLDFLGPDEARFQFCLLAIFNPLYALLIAGVCFCSTYVVLEWASLNDFYKQYKQKNGKRDSQVARELTIEYESWRKQKQQQRTQTEQSKGKKVKPAQNNLRWWNKRWNWAPNVFPSSNTCTSHSHSLPCLSLKDMLAVMFRLEIFMDFLLHEFAHENLLAVIELTQFEAYHMGQSSERDKELQQASLPTMTTTPTYELSQLQFALLSRGSSQKLIVFHYVEKKICISTQIQI
ncbi:hypothetical protein RFI_30104 [Reticulomyxa filosa]|uniref:RGS domain-containing protein n=1 Tax=Reticulomyxa filosa TaxID=46433 RepID=X6M076_RETFI|nr:hypothetical protein RFI_30104 [Reticulomyxa filosa]|eukprot:ETO07289.1 hypothetical protein RFI_30104 [Reticulomyxa filosa]